MKRSPGSRDLPIGLQHSSYAGDSRTAAPFLENCGWSVVHNEQGRKWRSGKRSAVTFRPLGGSRYVSTPYIRRVCGVACWLQRIAAWSAFLAGTGYRAFANQRLVDADGIKAQGSHLHFLGTSRVHV